MIQTRIGHGYDMHQLEKGTHITLGGIQIDSNYSVVAHSDGDIILHSLSDAIYGSLADGDIGTHFPSNEENKNIQSSKILSHACMLIKKANYEINNVDITIVIETPYLQPYILDIRKSIANIMSIDIAQISIKSSTSQKIGIIGEHKAVACYSTILISYER
jgi:2-C-methyl-D-erythritol 2,4-cyclodiphosphate synthase